MKQKTILLLQKTAGIYGKQTACAKDIGVNKHTLAAWMKEGISEKTTPFRAAKIADSLRSHAKKCHKLADEWDELWS